MDKDFFSRVNYINHILKLKLLSVRSDSSYKGEKIFGSNLIRQIHQELHKKCSCISRLLLCDL